MKSCGKSAASRFLRPSLGLTKLDISGTDGGIVER
jgi:hypothetical protein